VSDERERQAAIAEREHNQLLAAGAGSGKTTVLVDRYLSLLEDGCGVTEVVAVTFTEKAAAEMKVRVREKCD